MPVIGKYAPDGSTEIEATDCAITGLNVLGEHHITQRITGTPFYYRYLSNYEHLMTPEKRLEIAALAGQSQEPEFLAGDDSSLGVNFSSSKRKVRPETPDQSAAE